MDMPLGNLAHKASAVMQPAAASDIAPEQAMLIIAALAGMAKIIKTTELTARIDALEAKPGKSCALVYRDTGKERRDALHNDSGVSRPCLLDVLETTRPWGSQALTALDACAVRWPALAVKPPIVASRTETMVRPSRPSNWNPASLNTQSTASGSRRKSQRFQWCGPLGCYAMTMVAAER